METLTPLDVFLFWSKRIPEHAVKPPSLASDLVLLNFFHVSRSLANEAVEHILTALSLSLLLLVSGTGIKFQRLICLFPPRSRCLQDAIGLPGAAPISEEGVRPCLTAGKMYGASQQCLYSGSGCLASRARCQMWPFYTRVSARSQDFCSKRLESTWMLTLG